MSPKQWISMALVALLAAGAGWIASMRWMPSLGASGSCPGGANPLYWKAPMNPTYIRDKPGKSPMGMDLVAVCPGTQSGGSDGLVRIDPGLVQTIGVRTAVVERRDLARKIRAVGRIDYDERRVAHVHTKIQGWVEKLHIDYEGQMVKRGQPLLDIYSPELVSTQEELLVAARYRDTTHKSPFEDIRRGGSELYAATRRRLELWDIPEREIQRLLASREVKKTLTLYAPTSGVVTLLTVRQGMEVGPNKNLYTIADLSDVWVYADVYEYELPWVRQGQRGIVELSYLPGSHFEGRVTYVYPFLDPKARTARVRLELANPQAVLKPDMFANVTIETDPRRGILVVPDEAVIRSGPRNLVIVAKGEGRFEPRPLEIGLDSGDGWLEVKSGLSEGERVVTSSQFLIDSESNLREAIQKLLSPKASSSGRLPKASPPRAAGGMTGAMKSMPGGETMQMPPSGTRE